jgi:hypothetical protein
MLIIFLLNHYIYQPGTATLEVEMMSFQCGVILASHN